MWKGESWEQFEKETGLTKSSVGGIVVSEGKFTFDESLLKKQEEFNLPPAMGLDIVRGAQLLFDQTDFIMRASLLALFEDFPVSKKSLPLLS